MSASAAAASRIGRLTGLAVRDARVVGSQHGYQHLMVTLSGGRRAFVKAVSADVRDQRAVPSDSDPGLAGTDAALQVAAAFAAEANGLRWLAEAGAVPVPEVLAVSPSALVISMITPGRATPEAAFGFGADLARLHAAGADGFGAPWPGFIASLPLPNDGPAAGEGTAGEGAGAWPAWYADRRLLPYLRRAADAGTLGPAHIRPVEAVVARIADLAGPAEPPSRIHGDCWSGNVLWSGARGWLIDPAAHGGHRETDLAMLALFGVPFLDRILASYHEAVPLAAGWRARVPLHQLHPLLVHACLFGAGYAGPVAEAARAALAA